MVKIFDLDFRKGTLIDSVSGTKLTNISGSFKKVAKGLTYYSDNISGIYMPNIGNLVDSDFTLEIWLKPIDITGNLGYFTNCYDINNYILVGGHNDTIQVTVRKDSLYYAYKINHTTIVGKEIHLTFKWNATTNTGVIYENGIIVTVAGIALGGLSGTNLTIGAKSGAINIMGAAECYITKTSIWNEILTTIEHNELYKEFLNSSPTEKPVRGFEYPKPTDLSNETGLVAAYSFSPETVSNGTLIDVSGNGNHGTINGALLTKEGMKFDGVDDVITTANNTDFRDVKTINIRFTPLDTSGSSTRAIISYGETSAVVSNNGWLLTQVGKTIKLFYQGSSSISSVNTGDVLQDGNTYSISGINNNGTLSVYINGVTNGVTATSLTATTGTYGLSLGRYGANFLHYEIQDLKIYNYAFTPQQAKDYHNSFVKSVLIESFENNAVGDTNPKGWVAGTGIFSIQEQVDDII